jgi:hypothetical protein
METKSFTQHGKLMSAIFIPLILFNLFLLSESIVNHDEQIKYYALLSVLFSLCLLCFYKITITISATTLSFSMGIGLIKKSYRLNEIKSCKSHKNSFINGWGIRIIHGGWLYNVSGFQAVELRFKNETKVIRIGTDKPYEVVEEVNKLLK